MVPLQYAYLFGDLSFLAVWIIFYIVCANVRREMITMSLLIGIVSVLTAYFWWTSDWWHPLTITHTRVGIEDFLMGFSSGGVMAVAYEVVFKKLYAPRDNRHYHPSGFTILVMLALLTSWFIWGIGLSSFWASTLAMLFIASTLLMFRKDLFLNSILSGFLMFGISFLFYYSIIMVSPTWVQSTYNFRYLSGVLIFGIPIEELVFWFIAGLVFGPFYEYWKCQYLRPNRATKRLK